MTVRLTGKFKVKNVPDELVTLFSTYKSIVNELLGHAFQNNITSFYRLKSAKYKELRVKYPELPSHYIYTACQIATAIFKSWRKRKRRGKAKKKPEFRGTIVMLDDHLFKLGLGSFTARISTPNGKISLELYHSEYHEKFKGWKVGQAWLVRKGDDYYLNVVFLREVVLEESEDVIGIDLNENNVTIATPEGFVQVVTRERVVRTAYFVRRRKIQQKIKAGKRRKELLEKYGERERNRILDLYHKVANIIVELARKYNSAIALEDLKNIREHVRFSAELNGRLHRWSFRRLQSIIEYKARLAGVRVIFVNPSQTSSRCPVCGGKLSPNGYRVLKCKKCGFEADRDVVGSWNVRLRGLRDVGSSVPPESPPMTSRREGYPLPKVLLASKVAENQNGNLFTQVEEAMRIIMGHIGVRYEFEGGLRRKEVWDYPLDALREAIINALIHRDYTDPSNVQIKIFDDFIWIWNPGKLPEGISLEDLKKEMHPSKLRNPKIAQVFYYAGLIERWGTGTFKIVRLCLESGLPEPEFREEAGGFVVLLRKGIYTEDYLRKLGLNERQIKAVFYVKEKGSITNKEYQELFKVSRQTATRDLSELVKLGIFERVEKGRYKLKTHNESNMSQP